MIIQQIKQGGIVTVKKTGRVLSRFNLAHIESVVYQNFGNTTFDSDYQAILDKAVSLGYSTPTAIQRIKQNQFLLDLKSNGIWNALDVLYVFATDGGNQFATLNWKNPALFQATRVASPSFSTNNGFQGNGVTNYLNLNWKPSDGVNYTLNNSQFSIAHGNITLGVKYDGTIQTGTTGFSTISYPSANNINFSINGSNSGSTINDAQYDLTDCIMFFSRSSNANVRVQKNNNTAKAASLSSNVVSSFPFFLCGYNNAGGPNFLNTRRQRMFASGSDLGQSLNNAFSTLWNNYFTSL